MLAVEFAASSAGGIIASPLPLEAALAGPELFFGQSWESLPDVPAVGEFVPGYEASSWHGLPKATPAEIIDRLNNQINAALADPIMKARFAELGGIILGARPSTLASSLPKKPKRGPT